MKKCYKCGEEKELEEFTPNKTCKNGRTGECKKCHSKTNKEYALKNPEKVKTAQQKYVLNNKEKIKEASKKIRINDPGRFKRYREISKERGTYKSYDPEYYLKTKERWTARTEKFRLKNPEKYKVYAGRTRKKHRTAINERTKKWRLENPEKQKESSSNWRKENMPKVRELKRVHTSELRDYYIRMQLMKQGFTKESILENPELMELERIIIKTKRLCRTSKN